MAPFSLLMNSAAPCAATGHWSQIISNEPVHPCSKLDSISKANKDGRLAAGLGEDGYDYDCVSYGILYCSALVFLHCSVLAVRGGVFGPVFDDSMRWALVMTHLTEVQLCFHHHFC